MSIILGPPGGQNRVIHLRDRLTQGPDKILSLWG